MGPYITVITFHKLLNNYSVSFRVIIKSLFFLLILSASPCNKPLGLQSRRLPDSKITASSEYNQFHAARLGRLGQVKRGKFVGAWCTRHNNHYQWLKVDFGRPMKITKVCTQGRQDAGQWVTSFYLSSSVDNVHWSIYRFRSGNKVRNIPCRYFIIRKKHIFQNTSFKERFFCQSLLLLQNRKW